MELIKCPVMSKVALSTELKRRAYEKSIQKTDALKDVYMRGSAIPYDGTGSGFIRKLENVLVDGGLYRKSSRQSRYLQGKYYNADSLDREKNRKLLWDQVVGSRSVKKSRNILGLIGQHPWRSGAVGAGVLGVGAGAYALHKMHKKKEGSMKCPIMIKLSALKLEDIEDRLGQYLPDEKEEEARKMISEQRAKRWPLKYPAATIPLLGIPYAYSKNKAIGEVSRTLARKYPEVRNKIEQDRIRNEQATTERLKVTQAERAAGELGRSYIYGKLLERNT